MNRIIFFVIVFLAIGMNSVSAQKYFTRDGKISFFSDAALEKIEAHNSKATSVLDASSGKLEFAVLIKAFQFEKALMQEHFNENYMESSKYPKAKFKGQIDNMDALKLDKDGSYTVQVSGDMTIHGVSNKLSTPATITVKGGHIQAVTSFDVIVADYNIEIPSVVRDNIAKIVKVDVDVQYQKLEKSISQR